MALACLVAGDRHHHLVSEIRPARQAGAIVLGDRYLPSSLVLQRIDGLDWDTIWHLNTGVDRPDLAVILNADPAVLSERMSQRGGPHSRFEREPSGPQAESELYKGTATRLAALGWTVCEIDSTRLTAGEVAAIVTDRILSIHRRRPELFGSGSSAAAPSYIPNMDRTSGHGDDLRADGHEEATVDQEHSDLVLVTGCPAPV
jgi:dTMP kinase